MGEFSGAKKDTVLRNVVWMVKAQYNTGDVFDISTVPNTCIVPVLQTPYEDVSLLSPPPSLPPSLSFPVVNN